MAPADDTSTSSRLGWYGRLGGPLLAAVLFALPTGLIPDMPPAAQATAAITVWMAIWWMTEAVPLPVTSLLPLILFPLAGVLSFSQAASEYANQYVFLFMGGFMVARAIERWHLHRRIALLTVLAAGTRPRQLVAGFMIATAMLSMWISNTASTVMMLPIGMSLIVLIRDRLPGDAEEDGTAAANFATCMMLGIAYAASIGGVATLIGTPTNAFLAGFAADHDISIGFGRWMAFATPFSLLFLVLAWLLLVRVVFPIRVRDIPGGRQLIRDELAKMGPVSRGQWTVLVVFLLTATTWVLREPLSHWGVLVGWLPVVKELGGTLDTVIVLTAAISLFLIPVDARRGVFALNWETANTIPWGVLLLFGGGFSLAKAVSSSQLADWIGGKVAILAEAPPLVLILVVAALVVFLTELTSNTPTAVTFLPILHGVAMGVGIDPLLLLIPATIAASCAFMLPVATPPNAIVFGSGHISIRSMVRAGVWLNLIAVVLVVLWTRLWGISVFEIR